MFKLKIAMATAAAAFLTVGAAVAQMPSLGGPATPSAGPSAPAGMQTAVNAAKGYLVSYPSGWTVVNDQGLDYGLLSPDTNVLCLVNGSETPEIASISNDEIKRELSQPLGEEFWTKVFFSDVKNVKYLHIGADPNHPGGWPVQTVEATGDLTINGRVISSSFAGIESFKSGMQYAVMCFTPAPNYDAAKPQIAMILQSFKITKP